MKRADRVFALTLVAALVGLPGCGLIEQRQPSQVSQGHRFHSAVAEYDEFFSGLHEAQVLIQRWPAGERQPRNRLFRRLGLESEASSRDLAHALAAKTSELEASGLYLKLTWADSNGNTMDGELETDGRTPQRGEQQLIDAIEEEVAAVSKLYAKLKELDTRVDRLREKRQTLDPKVDDAFQAEGLTKRQVVRKNLDDGAKVLVALSAKLDSELDQLDSMAAILETNVQAEAPPQEMPEETAEVDTPTPARKSSYRPRRSRAPAATPDEPSKPSRPKDDFEP